MMPSTIPKSSQNQVDNESSLYASFSQDDEELLGTEIIPRCVPTAIQKDCRNSPPSKLKENRSHQDGSEILYNRETKTEISLSNSSAQKLKEVEENCNYESTSSTNGKINSVVLNRKLFTNLKTPSSSVNQSDGQQTHPSLVTLNLVERTSSILHKLSSLGLISSSDTSSARGDNNQVQHQNHETRTKPFLSLLYSMLEDMSSRHQNHSGHHIEPTDMERQFIGLLNMFESLLELHFKMSQEKAILETQCCHLHRNAGAIDCGFVATAAQQESDFTSTSQHQVVQSSQTISLLQQENDALRRQLMEVDTSQLMEIQNQLTHKQIECQKFQQIIQNFEHERKHLSHQCEEKDAVNFRFEKDLIELRNCNQARVKENDCLQAENFQLNQSIRNLEERLRQADENEHCSTIARSEVMAKWNDALKERTTLESKIGYISRELSMMKQQIHFSQSENTHLKHQMKAFENESQERLIEIASINRERNKVESEVVVLKQSLESIKMENDRLQKDLNASKMNFEANSQKAIEMQQIASRAQYDAESYKNTASGLEMERNAMKALLEDERKKNHKLESDLSTAQTRDAAASEQIRKIVKEKASYVTKLNEANARNLRIERSAVFQGPNSSSKYATPNDKNFERNIHNTPRVLYQSASNAHQKNQSHRKANAQEKVICSTSINEKTSLLNINNAEKAEKQNKDPSVHRVREFSVQEVDSLKHQSGEVVNPRTITLSNEPTSLLEYLSQDDVPTML